MHFEHGWSDIAIGRVVDVVPNPKRYYWIRFSWWFLHFELSLDCGPAGIHLVDRQRSQLER